MSDMMLSLANAMRWLRNATLIGNPAVQVRRVHTDTRTVEPGDLFVALKGERFDANDLLAEAHSRGAIAVICHPAANAGADTARYPVGLVRIEVPDTRTALAELAAGWRSQFALPLIAVTGSNGKTTVTQMIAAILRAWAPQGYLATQGNLNNDIGVPLTLLRLRPQHRIAVVELGMNHPGEIAALAALAQPGVALVNNAQREHLEFMHTVEAVAQENGSVISALPASGVAVFPNDDAFGPLWAALAGTRTTAQFSMAEAGQAATRCASARWSQGAWQVSAHTAAGLLQFSLHIAGRHNVKNALAAATCAIAAGVPLAAVAQGLAQFEPVKGRSRALSVTVQGMAITVVDDTYNANPDSVRAAIDVLAELPAPRILVLGDMGEVGEQGPQFHTEAGHYAQTLGIEHLLATGDLARFAVAACATGRHFDTVDALNAALLQLLPSVQSVLVKGSRFMRMERVVQALLSPEVNHAT